MAASRWRKAVKYKTFCAAKQIEGKTKSRALRENVSCSTLLKVSEEVAPFPRNAEKAARMIGTYDKGEKKKSLKVGTTFVVQEPSLISKVTAM